MLASPTGACAQGNDTVQDGDVARNYKHCDLMITIRITLLPPSPSMVLSCAAMEIKHELARRSRHRDQRIRHRSDARGLITSRPHQPHKDRRTQSGSLRRRSTELRG